MNTKNICDNKLLQQRIFSVMKQEVCIVFTVLSFFNPCLVCLQRVLILRLQYRSGPNHAELNVLALLYKPCWTGLVQLTLAQFMTVHTVKQTLSLSFSIVVTLSSLTFSHQLFILLSLLTYPPPLLSLFSLRVYALHLKNFAHTHTVLLQRVKCLIKSYWIYLVYSLHAQFVVFSCSVTYHTLCGGGST